MLRIMNYVLGPVFALILSFVIWEAPYVYAFNLPPYETAVLPNGLKLYYLNHAEVPLVELKIVVDVGSVNDGPNSGLASLTSDAVMLGSLKSPKVKLEEALDFLGVNWQVSTDKERSSFSFSFATKDFDMLLDLISEVFLHPEFKEDEFLSLQNKTMLNIDQAFESPSSVISDYFEHALYGSDPLGSPVQGSKAKVASIKSSDVKKFYETHYRPQVTRIIVGGDISKAASFERLEKLFGSWEQKPFPPVSYGTLLPRKSKSVLLIDKPDATQATFMIGNKSVPANFPKLMESSVLNTVLGGRFTSWLNTELRVNSGLTYGARSRLQGFKNTGVFFISTFTKTETTVQAIDLAFDTYEKLFAKGVSSEELKSGINYLKGQFPPKFETAGQLVNLIDNVSFYGLDLDTYRNFSEILKKMDLDGSKKLVTEVFPRENLLLVVIGNAATLKPLLSKYGEVHQISIKDQVI